MSFERRKYADAFAFLSDCEEELLRFEVEHSLMLGLASSLLRGVLVPDDDTLLGSVWREGVFQGAYLRSGRARPLLLSRMNEATARWLGSALDQSLEECQGVLPTTEIFARAYALRRSKGLHIEMSQGLYRLDSVEGHRLLAGEKMLPAADFPSELLRTWIEGFLADCFPGVDDVKERALKILEMSEKRGGLYLLVNSADEPVSMAARSRESLNGATISLVYTPDAQRRRGYAGRLVAELSRKILSDGKRFCTLYTDLKNPTSNAVYRKLGYVKVTESRHYRFWEKMD